MKWTHWWWKSAFCPGLWEKHSKNPRMADGGVARWFMEVEICPWVSNVPSPPIPPWKKCNCVFSKVKTTAEVQSFCIILKLSPLQSRPLLQGLVAVRLPQLCASGWESVHVNSSGWETAHVNQVGTGHHKERERETASLFHWDYISLGLGWTRCLSKMTN